MLHKRFNKELKEIVETIPNNQHTDKVIINKVLSDFSKMAFEDFGSMDNDKLGIIKARKERITGKSTLTPKEREYYNKRNMAFIQTKLVECIRLALMVEKTKKPKFAFFKANTYDKAKHEQLVKLYQEQIQQTYYMLRNEFTINNF